MKISATTVALVVASMAASTQAFVLSARTTTPAFAALKSSVIEPLELGSIEDEVSHRQSARLYPFGR